MAKNIKVIKCPNCGSIHKTEIKPDYFKCDNCQTEYFLDNNDINVNINYKNSSPLSNDFLENKKTIFTILGVFAGIIVIYFIGSLFTSNPRPQSAPIQRTTQQVPEEPNVEVKTPYFYESEKLYTNTATKNPVLMQLAREEVKDEHGDPSLVNVRTIFLDPINKKEIKDVILLEKVKKSDDHKQSYAEFKNGSIYMTYNNTTLYQLNKEADAWVDITPALVKQYSQMYAGIASIRFKDYFMTIITVDGEQLYYIPTTKEIYTDYKRMDTEWYKKDKSPYFEFRKDKNEDISELLVKMTPFGSVDQVKYEKILPNRKFFYPGIKYQDKDNLLIDVNVVYGPESPVSLQSLNVANGKVKWSLPARKNYTFKQATKFKDGFAVSYNLDGIEGVYVLSNNGEVISDYLLKNK